MCTDNLFENNYIDTGDYAIVMRDARSNKFVSNTFLGVDEAEFSNADGLLWTVSGGLARAVNPCPMMILGAGRGGDGLSMLCVDLERLIALESAGLRPQGQLRGVVMGLPPARLAYHGPVAELPGELLPS